MPAGIPDRSCDLDVFPGFKDPPPGYGEVPFWWWTGDSLHLERLAAQLKDLHKKSISGVQVNYSHFDTPGWLTDQGEPEIFTDRWWEVFSTISDLCAELDMGIGLSTYTLDWPRGAPNLFYQLFYSKPELNALRLEVGERLSAQGGDIITLNLPEDVLAVHAYQKKQGMIEAGGLNLNDHIKNRAISWQALPGDWEIWVFRVIQEKNSFNPLMTGAGERVISGFFQPFEDHSHGGSPKGLNYFFNDELQIGLGKFSWNPDFAEEFSKRKGYDLFEFLPAMWEDIGNITPKLRMDYADVRMSLMEERYFRPIYEWHAKRGMIYGCDSGGRGLQPDEFGDYFRATRWYTAPGHDTPGGRADLIKGKVSSSIANLYQRPRVWLEGYHSLGWGATPEQLMFATRENFLYGCNLLNLHGLYYTTYGSFWEWAPPCYHFRMPYWKHMDVFLQYYERLSYLLSQGHAVNDVAVIYPVAPYEAGINGEKAKNTAFELGRKLMAEGISFEFIDHESLSRATVENGLLKVEDAGAAYRVLVFPDMSAVRWTSIEKAADFVKDGGKVYSIGVLPTASDRAGRDDVELARMNGEVFLEQFRMTNTEQAVESIRKAFIQDVQGINQTVRSLHRKAGFRDVFMVMDARPNTVVEFRAKGAVEIWDPWTGLTSSLRVIKETATGTQVELPLEEYEANIVVFNPGKKHVNPPEKEEAISKEILLPSAWTVSFIPTMDNTWGDFRMPVTEENKTIGLEARRFAWHRENEEISKTAMLPGTDDSRWESRLHGYGTQFYVLGPINKEVDIKNLEYDLSHFQRVDPEIPVKVGNSYFKWTPYDFSWRWGKEGDQGHQGYHGLKGKVTDDFLCLGKSKNALNEIQYVEEIKGGQYFVWSSVTVEQPLMAELLYSINAPKDKTHSSPVLKPAAIFVNGVPQENLENEITLRKGSNPILFRFDNAGRGHVVIRRQGVPQPENRKPLSMKWWEDNGVIPFDVLAGERTAEWFRFITAPGTSAIQVIARGEVEAWIDGNPMKKEKNGRFIASKVPSGPSLVALRVYPGTAGITGGELIPDPVKIETDGSGLLPIGDFSKVGILHNYSGGVSYKTKVKLTRKDTRSEIIIDLGEVAGTAEVLINNKKAGVKVAPPWKLDVGGFFKPGENEIEIIVYNTLANHYQTIPSKYRGDPKSGLLKRVRLVIR